MVVGMLAPSSKLVEIPIGVHYGSWEPERGSFGISEFFTLNSFCRVLGAVLPDTRFSFCELYGEDDLEEEMDLYDDDKDEDEGDGDEEGWESSNGDEDTSEEGSSSDSEVGGVSIGFEV